jgi:hypothetical protein
VQGMNKDTASIKAYLTEGKEEGQGQRTTFLY